MGGTYKGKADEERIQGTHACRAVFERRRKDIVKVFVAKEEMRTHRKILQWADESKTLDRIVPRVELDKIARSTHHEGIFFLAKAPRPWQPIEALNAAAGRVVVVLEDIKDPHNLGAILRVCAHFDAGAVFCTEDSATRSPAMFRTAQGGAEAVPMVYCDNATALDALRQKDYTIVATSPHEMNSLFDADVLDAERCAVVFGAERAGISEYWEEEADSTVTIPGTGHVESLNISCAASAVLGEVFRRRTRAG